MEAGQRIMPLYSEESLSNIVVRVNTPPVLPPPPNVPQEIFDPVWYAHTGTYPITDDRTSSLLRIISKGEHSRESLLKTYKLNPLTNEPEPAGLIRPDNPPEEWEDALETENIYQVRKLSGLSKTYSQGEARPYDNLPSGVLIKPINSIISTPYIPKDPKNARNGVLGNAKNVNPGETTYLWRCWETVTDPRTGQNTNVLQPRPDGAVEMLPQPRVEKNPRQPIVLTPSVFETSAGIKNGKDLNSFALLLSIVPGCSDNSSSPPPWSIQIVFGEVTLKLEEGRPEMELTYEGKEPVRIAVNPSAGSRTLHHYGERPYLLSFIPVWNGLLISDSPPGATNWSDNVTFVPKNSNASVVDAMNKALWPPSERGIARRVPLPLPFLRNGNRRTNRRYVVAIEDEESTRVSTGKSLIVTYHRCGGMVRFLPIHFPTGLKIHTLRRGSAEPQTTTLSNLDTTPTIPPQNISPPPPPSPPSILS